MLQRSSPVQTAIEMVTLDQLVPKDHLLRKIEAVIDFSFIHELTAPLYCADNGRPALDPTVMFKALFDASTLSQNPRRRYQDTAIAQAIFDRIVEQAMAHGLADGTTLYTDST